MEVITMSIAVGEYFRNMIQFSKPDEWNLDNINNAINKLNSSNASARGPINVWKSET